METQDDSKNPEINVKELSKHLISQEKSKLLAEVYEKNNYALINEGKSKPDTKYVSYNIDVLVNYLNYVKKEAESKGVNDVKIAIVFGQYPENEYFDERLNPDYKGQQTVFLKPIFNSENSLTNMEAKSMQTNLSTGIDYLDMGTVYPPAN